jgi:deoxyribonuclease-4
MQGALRNDGEIEKIMDYCMKKLGREKMNSVHIHFSPIKFGPKGELGHLDFETAPKEFVPPFEPLVRYIKTAGLTPTIICESSQAMAQDALALKKKFEKS